MRKLICIQFLFVVMLSNVRPMDENPADLALLDDLPIIMLHKKDTQQPRWH